ncbi:bisanhydrobacterioruberin hydratase [Halomicrobium katesii]|uniref:bisanhydrobacterioruberin hydratase n=1 Tax=Halomicrobium katesii TaxID=437163 RepID=UPI00036EEC7A|nr:bisanhydrobacterioruberin hydratase [Halomicrobium katesii]
MDDLLATPTRERALDRLDELVLENRFTIAVVFPVTGAVLLTASALQPPWLPDALAFHPLLILLGTLVMRLPLGAGLAPLVDRRAGVALALLTAYAYAIEFVGIATGWPYGEFAYGVSLGPMLAGEVPLGLPIFFVPLVVNSYLLCTLLLGEQATNPWLRLPAVIATVLAIDLVLDPGAVALGFWEYGGGSYYGVPRSNYEGWILSATVAVLLLDWGFDWQTLGERLRSCAFMLDDMVSFVILWGAINAVFGNWLPVGIAAVLGLGLVVTDRFDVPTRPRWMGS